MKKILSAILALLMIVPFLVACDKKEDKPEMPMGAPGMGGMGGMM